MTVLISRRYFFVGYIAMREDKEKVSIAVSVVQMSGSYPGQSRSKGVDTWPETSVL